MDLHNWTEILRFVQGKTLSAEVRASAVDLPQVAERSRYHVFGVVVRLGNADCPRMPDVVVTQLIRKNLQFAGLKLLSSYSMQ